MAYKWEIFKDKAGEYRARFKYNSEIMFFTEGYTSKQSAMKAIASMKKNGPDAEVVDTTPNGPAKRAPEKRRPDRELVFSRRNEVVIPLGFGVTMTGQTNDPTQPMGISIRALPDDLVSEKKVGEPLSDDDIARVLETDGTAPSFFLLFKNPDAAESFGNMLIDWSETWRDASLEDDEE